METGGNLTVDDLAIMVEAMELWRKAEAASAFGSEIAGRMMTGDLTGANLLQEAADIGRRTEAVSQARDEAATLLKAKLIYLKQGKELRVATECADTRMLALWNHDGRIRAETSAKCILCGQEFHACLELNPEILDSLPMYGDPIGLTKAERAAEAAK